MPPLGRCLHSLEGVVSRDLGTTAQQRGARILGAGHASWQACMLHVVHALHVVVRARYTGRRGEWCDDDARRYAQLGGCVDGTGASVSFHSPRGVAVSPDGLNLFVADYGNHAIRKVRITRCVQTPLSIERPTRYCMMQSPDTPAVGRRVKLYYYRHQAILLPPPLCTCLA